MSEESASGQAVAERVRAADIAVGGNSPVTAMLANSLRERKPLADDGALHDTVQDAVNAASAFVFVPPGTFNESVTIDTAGLTLLGSGKATRIVLSTQDAPIITVEASNVTVDSIYAEHTGTGGTSMFAVSAQGGVGASNNTLKNMWVASAESQAIRVSDGTDWLVDNVTVTNSDNSGMIFETTGFSRVVIKNCNLTGSIAGSGIRVNDIDDAIIANNIVDGATSDGINADADDSIIIGNRISNVGRDGITIAAGNGNIIANNRVSDSGASDIDDNGSGTTLDANLTGASN